MGKGGKKSEAQKARDRLRKNKKKHMEKMCKLTAESYACLADKEDIERKLKEKLDQKKHKPVKLCTPRPQYDRSAAKVSYQ